MLATAPEDASLLLPMTRWACEGRPVSQREPPSDLSSLKESPSQALTELLTCRILKI